MAGRSSHDPTEVERESLVDPYQPRPLARDGQSAARCGGRKRPISETRRSDSERGPPDAKRKSANPLSSRKSSQPEGEVESFRQKNCSANRSAQTFHAGADSETRR